MWKNNDSIVSIVSNSWCGDSFMGRGVVGCADKNPITCTDKINQRYIDCLFDQNGYSENSWHYIFGSEHVRGEILEIFNSDSEIKGEDQHLHQMTDGIKIGEKGTVDNTLCKTSCKSRVKPETPRTVFIDFPVGICYRDTSENVEKIHDLGSAFCQGNGQRTLSLVQDISYIDSGFEFENDSLDTHLQIFINHCNAKYHDAAGNKSYGSHDKVNCVESDGDHSDTEIVETDGLYNRADNVVLNRTVVDAGRFTLSHGLMAIDAMPSNDETRTEPIAESLDGKWDIDEDYASSEKSGSLSCIESISISSDNDSCLEVRVITADNLKDDDGDAAAAIDDDGEIGDDDKQVEHVNTDQHSLARNYTDQLSTKVESTGSTTFHYTCIKLNTNEEHETPIYDDLNEHQSGDIVLHLNSKLSIVPNRSFSQKMHFFLGSISQTILRLSPRESKLRSTLSGCSFIEKGIQIAIRHYDESGSLSPSRVQLQLDSIPFSELGIAVRDFNFKLGALDRWSDDDENPFKQRSGLKWIFQYGFVPHRFVLSLQHWLRHHLYPFTNIKDFWVRLGTDSPPSLEECMSVEWMRYQSFQNYPISAHGSTSRLARDGFYYTGQGTQTRCFSCGITHSDWNRTDNPHEVHQRLSPNCPFLNGRQERYPNIPMSLDGNEYVGRVDRDSIPLPSLPFAPLSVSGTGQNQAEGRRLEFGEGSGATKSIDEDNTVRLQQSSGSGETTHSVQSYSVEESAQSEADNRPKFPEKVSLPSRIATFSHGWPPYLDQTPQQMAEAGFFFTGSQDYTRCYQCGGGLRNWEPGDNPWIEHCRWYPMCPHVQKGKGQRFVNAVLKKQAELLATQRAESRRKAQYGSGSTDPMDTLAAITLLEMGYPRDTVRNSILILRRQREPAADITAQEVLDFIWKEEDIERQRQEEEASRPCHPGDPQPPALPTLMERLNLGGSPAVTQVAVPLSASITTTTSSLTKVAMATSSTSN